MARKVLAELCHGPLNPRRNYPKVWETNIINICQKVVDEANLAELSDMSLDIMMTEKEEGDD